MAASQSVVGLGALDPGYYLAMAFGAAIVVVFAWDQFNRPSYEASRELTRLIELLTPSRMRKRTVYWRAYLFYTGILLLIYVVLCVYGLIIGPTLGLALPGTEEAASVGASALPEPAAEPQPASGYNPDAIAALPQLLAGEGEPVRNPSDPTIPLVISLIMVGLAPSFPLLLKAEAKIRFVAHQLSGIPTRLIGGGRKLRETRLELVSDDLLIPPKDGLLIPPKDWRRLKHYPAAAKLDDSSALLEDLEKIVAFRAWVLQEKLPLANFAIRDSLSEIETDIRKGIERLMFTLDALSNFDGTGASRAEPADPERVRAAWEAAARDADQICADICVLSMLYVEHGVLPTEDTAASFGWGVDPGEGAQDAARQKVRAEGKLMRHLSAASRYVDQQHFAMTLWLRATAAVLLVSFLFGSIVDLDTVQDGEASLAGGSRMALGLLFALQGALTYALALLVAISWHQTAYKTNGWRNVFEHNWSQWLPQILGAGLMAGLAAVFCVVGFNVYATIGVVGVQIVIANAVPVLAAAVEYEGPRALLGGLLGILVILLIDAWRSEGPGARYLPWLPLAATAAMCAAGVGARLMSAQVGARLSGATLDFESRDLWEAAIAAGIWAGLVAAAVTYFVRETLTHDFARVKDAPSKSKDQERVKEPPTPEGAESGAQLAQPQ